MKFIPVSETLKESDYARPFNFNDTHYFKINEVRKERGLPVSSDYKETYDSRTGHYITGEKIETKHHPYHDMWLVDTHNNKRYHIDSVSIHHHFGKYLVLMKREEGSESHGVVYFENISCHYPVIVESIEENKDKYKLIKK